jgi:uncharacterized RDD family membrane protein YckC
MPADSPADTLSVETPEAVAFAYDLAGPASRGAALIVDTVLLALIILAEGLAVVLAGTLIDSEAATPWLIAVALAVAFVTYWGYYVWGEVLRNGRTPGKQALGIRVVRDDGGRVGTLDSIIRNLIRIVDMLPGYYAIGLVSVLLSRTNKRLGDMAAGTVVVRDSGKLDLVFIGGQDSERVTLVREFLARRAQLTEAARWQVAAEILAAWGESPQPGWTEPVVAGRLADLAGAREAGGPAVDGVGEATVE